ncbi:protein kinase 4-like [Dreissena polymorpha]|uniref:protein kinase 4-like n=1 Tax=Dreissena polymorpha TaxID=45954 RepID=UPI002263FA09|nr:protein kinase 4-like [Dreissena polymorpha]
MLAEEKVRQEARQEADRLKDEKQREVQLRQMEEERRLVEEAERQKEAATRKQGSDMGSKSSSNSPSPPSAGPGTPQEGSEGQDGARQADTSMEKNKVQTRGKHKDDQSPLQVDFTVEKESTSSTLSVSTVTQSSHHPHSLSGNLSKLVVSGLSTTSESVSITAVCMSASSRAPRPANTGGKANTTPPSIDNRLILTAKHNKNRQPVNPSTYVGNGNMRPAVSEAAEVTSSNNHMAIQQQELLKKQTQQLIQLKVKQELKNQQQQQQQQQQAKLRQQNKQSQHQQQRLPPVAAGGQKDGAKKPADINGQQNSLNHGNAKNAFNAKPTVQINNSKETGSASLRTEPVVNRNNQAAPSKAPLQGIDGSLQKAAAQQDQSQSASKGKATIRKPEDNLNQQNQSAPQLLRNGQLASAHQSGPAVCTPGHLHLQQNGFIGQGLPAMGQVRQSPQGQAEHNGEARTPTLKERDKGKQLQNSPPSDQGFFMLFSFCSQKMWMKQRS